MNLEVKKFQKAVLKMKTDNIHFKTETSLSFEDKRSPHFLLRRMNGNMALMMKTGFLKFIQEVKHYDL